MINKQLGSSECQRVNPSNLFANQVNDVKCENKGTNDSGVSILLSNQFLQQTHSIQGSNGGGQLTHRCCQILQIRRATLHPAEEKHAVTADRSG